MRKFGMQVSTVAIAVLSMTVCSAAVAGLDEDIEKTLNIEGGKYGKVNFDARYRYEYVDQDSGNQTTPVTLKHQAHASTLRLRVGYLTPVWEGFSGFAEYEGNQDIGVNDYNSTRNYRIANNAGSDKRRYPIVADPQANEVNQLWINYAGLPDTNVKLGRQRIVFDNHRFVGDVGWRQMQQTFDAAMFTNKSLPDTTITAGYIWKVQDITSRSIGMNSPIFNIAYTGLPFGKLVAHGEWLDYDNYNELYALTGAAPPANPRVTAASNSFTRSTKTLGLRFDGSMPIVDNLKALYTAEYARQEDYKNNPVNFQADYWMGEGGLDIYGVKVTGAIEKLGSDNGVGFNTPLATLHAFQGWADKFLYTPAGGIRDVYGTVKTNVYGVDFIAMYHEFSDASSHIDYGHEFDFLAEKKFGKHYSVMVKYADFVGDTNRNPRNTAYSDTQKIWLQGGVNF